MGVWVTGGDGRAWQVCPPTGWDLLCAGLLAIPAFALVAQADAEAEKEWERAEATEEQRRRLAERDAADARRRRDKLAANHRRAVEAIEMIAAHVGASVRAGGCCPVLPPGEVAPDLVTEAEPLRVVLDRSAADPEADPPRIWVEAIPATARAAIGEALSGQHDLSLALAMARDPEACTALDALGRRYRTRPSKLLRSPAADLAVDLLCLRAGQQDAGRVLSKGAIGAVLITEV